MTLALSAAALICGYLHIRADYRRLWGSTYVLKPLTMAMIILIAIDSNAARDSYGQMIIVGLLCSLAGDVFLMLKPARFLAGLSAFLLAHVAYVIAFASIQAQPSMAVLVIAFFCGAMVLALLWPGLGRLKFPVVLYVTALVLMVWLAVSAWLDLVNTWSLAAAVGAALFLISDSLLGYARFRRRFDSAQAMILGTYYLAQWMIALSAGPLRAAAA